MLAICKVIDEISRRAGIVATWLVLLAALVSAFNAFARYSVGAVLYADQKLGLFGGGLTWLFDLYRDNSNTMSDLQLAMFAAMVMLGAPWTLRMNEHVRVDLVYGSVSPRDIADVVSAGGISINRTQVPLDQAIKTIGLFTIGVRLHPEVRVKVTINVARSEDEAERQSRGEDVLAEKTEQEEAKVAAEELFEEGAGPKKEEEDKPSEA